MLTQEQKTRAQEMMATEYEATVDGHSPTCLSPTTRADVETWAGSGVAGDLDEEQARKLAAAVVDDAHDLGLHYGEAWAPMIDALGEREFCDYVDAALLS